MNFSCIIRSCLLRPSIPDLVQGCHSRWHARIARARITDIVGRTNRRKPRALVHRRRWPVLGPGPWGPILNNLMHPNPVTEICHASYNCSS